MAAVSRLWWLYIAVPGFVRVCADYWQYSCLQPAPAVYFQRDTIDGALTDPTYPASPAHIKQHFRPHSRVVPDNMQQRRGRAHIAAACAFS